MTNSEIFEKVVPYFSLVHSTPGRLRVRVSSKIKELGGDVDLNQIDAIIARISGIESVKFNKMIGSVTISYDNEKFPENLWKDLLEGKNLAAVSAKIDEAKKEFECRQI